MFAGNKIAGLALVAFVLVACDPAADFELPGSSRAEDSCRVSRVIDGDTVVLTCTGSGVQRARLMGFDTPEVFSPRCAAERAKGMEATRYLRRLLARADTVTFAFRGTDRYGRSLTQMRIDGKNVAGTMVAAGLAVRYSGGKRINWCSRLARA